MPDPVSPLLIEPTAIYTEGQLCRCLGLSSSALARGRKHEGLRSVRKGHRTLYLGRWILDWIAADATECRVSAAVAG